MDLWIQLALVMSGLVEAADIGYLQKAITNHFSKNRNHVENNSYKTQARQFIYDEFTKYGFEAEYHNFTWDRFPTVGFVNVIGVMKGANFGTVNDKIVGVVAHYDTVQNTSGVDDNGAGVAAMLEVARQLSDLNLKGVKRSNTLLLVSSDLEEYNDCVGSKTFILDWVKPWLSKNYGAAAVNLKPHGFIVLDTMMEYNTSSNSQQLPPELETAFQFVFPDTYRSISSDSFRGDFLAMVYRAVPDNGLAQSLSKSWPAAGQPQFQLESFALPGDDSMLPDVGNFLRSDHRNFWAENIPAIFLTDSANFRGDMIQCYHFPCDNLEVMLTDENIQFLGKTADSIARTVNELSVPLNTRTGSSGSRMKFSFVLGFVLSLLFSEI